jgi:hypothetical protein
MHFIAPLTEYGSVRHSRGGGGSGSGHDLRPDLEPLPIYALFLFTTGDSPASALINSHLTELDALTGKYCLAFVPVNDDQWKRFVEENREYWVKAGIDVDSMLHKMGSGVNLDRLSYSILDELKLPPIKLPSILFFKSLSSNEILPCSLEGLKDDELLKYLRSLFGLVRSTGETASTNRSPDVGAEIWTALKSHPLVRWNISKKKILVGAVAVGVAIAHVLL